MLGVVDPTFINVQKSLGAREKFDHRNCKLLPQYQTLGAVGIVGDLLGLLILHSNIIPESLSDFLQTDIGSMLLQHYRLNI